MCVPERTLLDRVIMTLLLVHAFCNSCVIHQLPAAKLAPHEAHANQTRCGVMHGWHMLTLEGYQLQGTT
jgi:hypothetical protein